MNIVKISYKKNSSFYGKFVFAQIFLFGFLIFLIISVKFQASYIIAVDNFVFYLCDFIRSSFINNLMLFITYLGESIVVIFILFLLFLFKIKKIAIPLSFITISSVGVNYIIKNIIQRARPVGEFVNNLIIKYEFPTNYSFPSGHSQTALVFYFCLSYLFIKKYYKGKHTKLLSTISLILPILIMISRLILGVHYFSDVLAGAIIGTIIILTIIYIEKTKTHIKI